MAGVDIANQFPNSFMARAVKMGQSRMVSDDVPSRVLAGEQNNVSIVVATGLTVPTNAANPAFPATYAIVTAVGGTMYATYDGTTPSNTNFAVSISAGTSLPVQGAQALAAIKVQGTQMSVSYWS